MVETEERIKAIGERLARECESTDSRNVRDTIAASTNAHPVKPKIIVKFAPANQIRNKIQAQITAEVAPITVETSDKRPRKLNLINLPEIVLKNNRLIPVAEKKMP